MGDTKTSQEQDYIGRDDTGSIVPLEAAYASFFDFEKYCISTGAYVEMVRNTLTLSFASYSQSFLKGMRTKMARIQFNRQ